MTLDTTENGNVIETPTEQAPAVEPIAPVEPVAPGEPVQAPVEPITYDFKLPEGFELDAELGKKFTEFAQSKKLTQEEAQSLLDLRVAEAEKQREADTAMRAKWVEESKADKEFGGSNFEQNLGVAKRAVDAFTTPTLRGLFDATGLGNHPEVIRAFVKIGKAMGEDKLVMRDPVSPAPAGETIAQRMYPNLNP